ncbi:MAG TPA: short-chain dehydrogenase, partial [Acidimicrobiales bacterium]|nr:short-chain dehydrogenase [Acidimicrobiales bacterium]
VHPGRTRTEATAGLVRERALRLGISEEEAEAGLVGATGLGRMVDAAEVAWVVTFLASPRSVAVNGDAVACGGGALGPIHY